MIVQTYRYANMVATITAPTADVLRNAGSWAAEVLWQFDGSQRELNLQFAGARGVPSDESPAAALKVRAVHDLSLQGDKGWSVGRNLSPSKV